MARASARCVVGVLLVAAVSCGGSAEESAAESTGVASESTAAETSPTTSTTLSATTTELAATTTASTDPFAVYKPTSPLDIAVAWTCDPLLDRGGGTYASGCANLERIHPIVDNMNWFVTFTYLTDESGVRTGIATRANGYGPACTWEATVTTPIEVPLVDGVATHTSVLVGGGHCEGTQWAYENTWDEATQSHVTTGVISPTP